MRGRQASQQNGCGALTKRTAASGVLCHPLVPAPVKLPVSIRAPASGRLASLGRGFSTSPGTRVFHCPINTSRLSGLPPMNTAPLTCLRWQLLVSRPWLLFSSGHTWLIHSDPGERVDGRLLVIQNQACLSSLARNPVTSARSMNKV